MGLQIPQSTALPRGETGRTAWRHQGCVPTSHLQHHSGDRCLSVGRLPALWPAAQGRGGGGNAKLKCLCVEMNIDPHEKWLAALNVLQTDGLGESGRKNIFPTSRSS